MSELEKASAIIDKLLSSSLAEEQIRTLDKRYFANYNKYGIKSIGMICRYPEAVQGIKIYTLYINFGYSKSKGGSFSQSIKFDFTDKEGFITAFNACETWLDSMYISRVDNKIDMSSILDEIKEDSNN